MRLIKKAHCLLPVLPTARLWAFCNRREPAARILSWAKARVSAIRSITAALIWGFLPRAKNLCAGYRDRLVGATVDKNGKRGFVLTLQTREQHIRREKATSNICSNEALCALAAGVYLAALGKNLSKLAALNIYKTQYLKNRLLELKGWKEVFSAPVYNEFVLRCPDAKTVNEKLKKEGIIGGYELHKDYPELENTCSFAPRKCFPKKI